MKCLFKYQWVKLPRNQLPSGKGIMGAWARLASRAAFRNGQATYCGHINEVKKGSWAGGVVGLKSILGIKNRQKAMDTLTTLSELGYVSHELDPNTKKLTYQINDWVFRCSGAACMNETDAVYATPGYGFLCLPRNITDRLVKQHYCFEEADAWLDLWCHTVWQDPRNAFSHTAPAVQLGPHGAVFSLESLGKRWGWEKTKVWRFFRKHADTFPLLKLPGSFGCLIFNIAYPTSSPMAAPTSEEVVRIFNEIRTMKRNTHFQGTDREQLGRMIAWYSKTVLTKLGMTPAPETAVQGRVALLPPILRAYISPCGSCKSLSMDCLGNYPCAREQDYFSGASPRDGPVNRQGGIDYGRFDGVSLW